MERLTMQEEGMMIYIWELESCYVKDIAAKSEQSVPPYITVASIVKNLERGKYVKAQRAGNIYLYIPAIKESEYKRSSMSGVVRNYFENSYRETVFLSAKDQKVPTNDLKETIDMIEKGKEN